MLSVVLMRDLNSHSMTIRGVIVNDMAELNIDARLVKTDVSQGTDLIQLQNGCICCTLRQDFVQQLAKMASDGHLDYCIVESTGISEPMQVASSLHASKSAVLTPAFSAGSRSVLTRNECSRHSRGSPAAGCAGHVCYAC